MPALNNKIEETAQTNVIVRIKVIFIYFLSVVFLVIALRLVVAKHSIRLHAKAHLQVRYFMGSLISQIPGLH